MQSVVVTGASGFIAKHVIVKLLNAGFAVRGTIRDAKKGAGIYQAIEGVCGPDIAKNLDLFECDLLASDGWGQVFSGVDALMHLATVVPAREPKDPSLVIRPAIEGTERVMRYASIAGVRRVVMTSSIAAIGYGQHKPGKLIKLGADDWTDVEGLKGTWSYPKAKTLSEKRAWSLAKESGMNLTVICPSMVLGPAVDADTSASLEIVKRLMNGQVPILPPGGMSVVDVRDVAQIHVEALGNESSHGKRIIASAQYMSFLEVADILRAAYPGGKFPSLTAPIWLMKMVGKFDRTIKQVAHDLETVRHYDGAPGAELMAREYRDGQEAMLAAAESLIDLGLAKSGN